MARSCAEIARDPSAQTRRPGDALFGIAVAIAGAGTLWGMAVAIALAWSR